MLHMTKIMSIMIMMATLTSQNDLHDFHLLVSLKHSRILVILYLVQLMTMFIGQDFLF
jgi:hypothetical protein